MNPTIPADELAAMETGKWELMTRADGERLLRYIRHLETRNQQSSHLIAGFVARIAELEAKVAKYKAHIWREEMQ